MSQQHLQQENLESKLFWNYVKMNTVLLNFIISICAKKQQLMNILQRSKATSTLILQNNIVHKNANRNAPLVTLYY